MGTFFKNRPTPASFCLFSFFSDNKVHSLWTAAFAIFCGCLWNMLQGLDTDKQVMMTLTYTAKWRNLRQDNTI